MDQNSVNVNQLNNKNTVKFSTVVFFVLGLILPFWAITLPLFWFISFLTFRSASGTALFNKSPDQITLSSTTNVTKSKFEELEKAKELLDSGALTQKEFDIEKQKILKL